MIIWSYYGTKLDYNITAESIMNKDDSDWIIRCPSSATNIEECVTRFYHNIDAPQAMAYSPLLEKWVVVRQGSGGALVGSDGKHWDYHSTPSGDWEDVVWVENPYGSGGYFVACNMNYDDEYKIMRSPDGINWEKFHDAGGGTGIETHRGITATSSGRLITGYMKTGNPPKDQMFMYSDNYGASWSYVPDTGIPVAKPVDKFAYSPDWNAIVCTTWSDVFLYSLDNGMHWTAVTIPKYGETYGPSISDVLWHPTIKRFFFSNLRSNVGPSPLYSVDSGWNITRHEDPVAVVENHSLYRIGSVPGQNYVLGASGSLNAYLFDFNTGEYYEIWYGCSAGADDCESRSTTLFTTMTVVGSRE